MEENKEALALKLAHALVMDAFLRTTTTYIQNGEGDSVPTTSPGPFWEGINRDDSEEVKGRLREMAGFIGDLARLMS